MGPASLTAGEILLGEEVTEAVVVGVESEMLATLEVMAEDLDRVDDGEEFLLMDGVVLLGRRQLAGLVTNGLGTVTLVLKQNCSNTNVRGVGEEGEFSIGTGEGDDEERGGDKGGFEKVE